MLHRQGLLAMTQLLVDPGKLVGGIAGCLDLFHRPGSGLLFFYLFINIPLEELAGDVVALGGCKLHERVYKAGHLLFVSAGSLERRERGIPLGRWYFDCLLYTSDAADDLLCVDLGGRRLIKKK